MEFRVIKGLCSPYDQEKKPGRRAVVIKEQGGYLLLAPATTYFARTGTVPRGSVLLTEKSTAYAGSGFDKPEILISLRDAMIIRKDSIWLKGAKPVGTLQTSKDLRFEANFLQTMKEYPPARIVEG